MEKKTWEEFQKCGLLWFVNRLIHIFGWAIVVETVKNESGEREVVQVYPARVDVRGFTRNAEEEGFYEITKYLSENSKDLLDEIKN
jgi:hypothetical protein